MNICPASPEKVTEEHDSAKDRLNALEKDISTINSDIHKLLIDYENIRVDSIHSEKLLILLRKHDDEMQQIKRSYFYFETSNEEASSVTKQQQHSDCPKLMSVNFTISVTQTMPVIYAHLTTTTTLRKSRRTRSLMARIERK